jgi:hypothetical protein
LNKSFGSDRKQSYFSSAFQQKYGKPGGYMAWLEFFKLSNVAKISAIDFAAMIMTYVWVVIFQQRNKKKRKKKYEQKSLKTKNEMEENQL